MNTAGIAATMNLERNINEALNDERADLAGFMQRFVPNIEPTLVQRRILDNPNLAPIGTMAARRIGPRITHHMGIEQNICEPIFRAYTYYRNLEPLSIGPLADFLLKLREFAEKHKVLNIVRWVDDSIIESLRRIVCADGSIDPDLLRTFVDETRRVYEVIKSLVPEVMYLSAGLEIMLESDLYKLEMEDELSYEERTLPSWNIETRPQYVETIQENQATAATYYERR